MTTREILESLRENYPDALTADGFDDAIVGIVEGACRPAAVCYDYKKCVKALMKSSEMDEEEAQEFFGLQYYWRRRAYDQAAHAGQHSVPGVQLTVS